MYRSSYVSLLLIGGLALLAGMASLLAVTRPAAAQCGADASSCRRCHEGDEAMPVDALGPWHVDHAGQDFCQLCHAGDKLAEEADAAHLGMIDPLGAQAETRCSTCHPSDSARMVEQYSTLLTSYSGSASTGPEIATALPSDDGYDWRNMALAGVAGMLTVVSGVVVWAFERPRREQ